MTDNALTVPMTTVTEDGLKITKTFYFERGKHSIDVNFEVENSSPNSLEVQPFYQLKQQIAGEVTNKAIHIRMDGSPVEKGHIQAEMRAFRPGTKTFSKKSQQKCRWGDPNSRRQGLDPGPAGFVQLIF